LLEHRRRRSRKKAKKDKYKRTLARKFREKKTKHGPVAPQVGKNKNIERYDKMWSNEMMDLMGGKTVDLRHRRSPKKEKSGFHLRPLTLV